MARLAFLVITITTLLSGCDPVYPPQFINAYGTAIAVTLTYSDGHTVTTVWPACHSFFVGKADAQVQDVTFERDGMPLREFTASEIRAMLERERGVRGYFAWTVSPDGVTPITDQNKGLCPQS